MLRGFRWQLLALLISIILFGTVLGYRFFSSDSPQAEATAIPTITVANTVAPTFTPQATAITTTEVLPQNSVITFTEGIADSVQRLNPLLISTQAERDISSLIFEGLVEINEFGEPVPDLALDWTASRDGYEYVMQLRQDVLWQDGLPFNANDVIFTYNLLAEPDFPMSEISQFWQTVEIEQLGSDLIRFRLAQPLASFPSLLTTGILPEHALRGTSATQLINHPFNLSPIGTGAYQLESLRSSNGQQIEVIDLRLAPTYRQRSEGQSGYEMSRLRFRLFNTFDEALGALVSGDIDGLASQSMNQRPRLLEIGNTDVFTQIAPSVTMLIFNWDEEEGTQFFSDLRVRNALQLSINRSNPVETTLINRAIVADSPLRPDSWAYNSAFSYPQPDPVRALELLDSANIIVPEDSDIGDFRFRFSILTEDTPELVAIAQNIANQWSQFNLDVRVEAVASEIYQARLATGDFDSAIVDYAQGADPDIFAYWHADQVENGLNYGAVSNSRVSEILERGRLSVSNLARVDIYQDFQVQFVNQVIAIPLYHPLYTYAVSTDIGGVQLGFINSQEDRFRNLQAWSIRTE